MLYSLDFWPPCKLSTIYIPHHASRSDTALRCSLYVPARGSLSSGPNNTDHLVKLNPLLIRLIYLDTFDTTLRISPKPLTMNSYSNIPYEDYTYNAPQMGRSDSCNTNSTTCSDDAVLFSQHGFINYDDFPPQQSSSYSLPANQTYLKKCPLDLFTETIVQIDNQADFVTRAALSYLSSEQGYQLKCWYEEGVDLPAWFITSQAIAERVSKSGHWDVDDERQAVGAILFEELCNFFTGGNQPQETLDTILHEAACHLLLRVEGDTSFEICRVSITIALVKVREELERLASQGHDDAAKTSRRGARSSGSKSEKGKFACHYPECNSRSFSRQADLERHRTSVHEENENYWCDYKKCPRRKQAFHRQDHFRDHLRDQHKEDLPRRGVQGDKEWWGTRNKHAVYEGWFRCSKCLTRVKEDCGFICPCGHPCEADRQRRRAEAFQ